MKNTARRIVSFAAAFVFAAVPSAVYAEETVDFGAVGNDETTVPVVLDVYETYIITIPKEIALHPKPAPDGKGMLIEGEGTVSAGHVFILPKGNESVGSVKVIISESSEFTISNDEENHTLNYKVSDDNGEYGQGETVLSVESDTTGETNLKFTLTENPKYMEDYRGTITFEVTGFTPTDDNIE